MFKVKLGNEKLNTYFISDGNRNYMHRDGTILQDACEYWVGQEVAQAVLAKFQPAHVWVRGDVVRCYDGTIVVCVQEQIKPIRIFGIGARENQEYATDINLTEKATFLFNIADKLKDFNG